MFGGLEIKGASTAPATEKKDDNEASDGAAATSSGFSFMAPSSSSIVAAVETPSAPPSVSEITTQSTEPEPQASTASAPASSGFSFMSDSTSKVSEEKASSVESSGFSFMASIGADSNTNINTVNYAENTNNDTKEENSSGTSSSSEPASETTPSVSSSFNFLATTTSISTVPVPPSVPVPVPVPASVATITETQTKTESKPTNDSLFSMLSTTTATKPPLPSSAASTSDFLMQTNPSQPTGAGIVFGGAAKPKTVKKRARGKKIGVGGSSATSSTTTIPAAAPLPILPEPTYEVHQQQQHNYIPTAHNNNNTTTNESDLKSQAEEAANRADEFISSKVTSSSSSSSSKPSSSSLFSYTGRYSTEKSTVVEDYGETATAATTSNNNDYTETEIASSSISSTSNNKEKTYEYKKAMAAAEEAKHLSGKKMGFMGSGGFGGLFKRGFSSSSTPSPSYNNTSSNSSIGRISNESNHSYSQGGEKKSVAANVVEMKIPTYGEPNDTVTEQYEAHNQILDHNDRSVGPSNSEEEMRQELEWERNRKELQRQELERKRYENELMERNERIRREEEETKKKYAEAQLKKQQKDEELQRLKEEEAKRRTPGDKLNTIIHQFSLIGKNNTCFIAELRQQRTSLIERRSISEKQERLATQQISQSEKQQLDAAEKEDFELADRLAAVIEQHEEEKKEHAQSRYDIEGLIKDVDEKRVNRGKKLLSCFEDVQSDLKQFLAEQKNAETSDSTEVLKKFEADTKRLSAENERLNADLKNIERDETFASEERSELEATISEQTEDIEKMRDETRYEIL